MAIKNSKVIGFIAVLSFSAIGLIIMLILQQIIGKMTGTGLIGGIINFIHTNGLVSSLIWLIVCIIVYFGVARVVENGEKINPFSLFFLILLLGSIIGLFIGNIVTNLVEGFQVILSLDYIFSAIFSYSIFSLGISFSAALAITNKLTY